MIYLILITLLASFIVIRYKEYKLSEKDFYLRKEDLLYKREKRPYQYHPRIIPDQRDPQPSQQSTD